MTARTRYEIRPLGPWTDPVTRERRGSGRFRASWTSTLELLAREVEYLDGGLIVLQIDVTAGEVRRDGMLRIGAKVGFPGVRVSFDSRHGPLTYGTDAYGSLYYSDPPGWQANIRAIALALEALRAVDRYGVSSRGEQYRGWTPIDSRPAVMTRDQAAELIAQWAHPDDAERRAAAATAIRLGEPADALSYAYKLAARRCHPDVTGGDADTMTRLNVARDLLLEGHRG